MSWDWGIAYGWLNAPFFTIGETQITTARVVVICVIFVFVWWFSSALEHGLRRVALHGRSHAKRIRRVGPDIIGKPGGTNARLLWALEDELTARGIEIPFPQRDIHIRSGLAPSMGSHKASSADSGAGPDRGA